MVVWHNAHHLSSWWGIFPYLMLMSHSSSNLYSTGGTFALYSLLCRHANIKIIPNQDRTDEELTTYSRSVFPAEQSFAARTKRWLEGNAFKKNALLVLVLIGTCMVIGDGILTPAISGMYPSSLNPWAIKSSHLSLWVFYWQMNRFFVIQNVCLLQRKGPLIEIMQTVNEI
jgi:hypothetical protein